MNITVRTPGTAAPIGYFVHHQGRGHAERCAAIVNALPPQRPVTIFCARDDIFPPLRSGVEIRLIPSLFEATGDEAVTDFTAQPDTLHCAPLGWPGIRTAMATMAQWFMTANPALMICDVSAEVAQLARICSVPHVKVLQHGTRTDPAHRAAYDGAAGLLVPSAASLAQDDWDASMRAKTHFAGGLGVATALPARAAARARMRLAPDRDVVLVLSGGGGTGFPSAPLAVGARALPDSQWLTVGQIARDWHATEPANLRHDGWVDGTGDHIAAADCIVASTGNTTCQQILAAGKPWVAVPEWRYFDEQVEKARVLHRAGVAHAVPGLPSSVQQWRAAIRAARDGHDPARQQACTDPDAAATTADWLESLIARLWSRDPAPLQPISHADALADI
ncbi:hypothetical protein SAMN04488003_1204 [Loktanella fryxellensis]|uniref:Glycosyl transferase family 28 C-terminal domain-containing protein n=1 Tax=Loktanella fryxellensis TaxID=245187 RepID=A0A1H8H9Z2_9RHOB|nr:hypothetical protein [Loktanella fryxellensis]SEN52597.1 hypothetical protein SAMN04488003_1204 [Loktanella fryxellensis]